MQPTAITDVKELAQNMEDIVSLKNWTNRRVKIYPDYNRTKWTSEQTATFSISSTDLDMWDIQGSSIWIRLLIRSGTGTAPHATMGVTLPRGTVGLINRFTVKNGAFTVQDVEHYNDYLWTQWVLHNGNHSDPEAWMWTDNDLFGEDISTTVPASGSWGMYDASTRETNKLFVPNANTTEKGVWLRLPLISVLDKTSYIPMYNLGEKLQLEIKWAADNEVFTTMIVGANTAKSMASAIASKYEITDMYMDAVGLQALEGGVLTGQPFIFTSFNVMGFTASPNSGQSVVKLNHDLKKTSVKKSITIIRPKELKIGGSADADSLLTTWTVLHRSSSWSKSCAAIGDTGGGIIDRVTKFHGLMGGTIYPYPTPLESYREYYDQLKRYGEQHSVFKSPQDTSKWMIEYNTNYLNNNQTCGTADKWHNSRFRFFPMIFDRLDQSSTIISGQDSERYTLQQVWEANNGLAADTMFLTFYDFNVVVTISGGEIVVND